ncbi:MAG: mycofactocin biosynthesis chaperone MftB [Frankiaceae bacterium]|jgi:putative mycofactocin binding protein MftB
MTFDANRYYRISSAVTLRPEPFGALAYHFGQRRLTYLAAADLVAVIGELAKPEGPHGRRNASQAMAAAGVSADRRPAIESALASLVDRGVLDAT